MENLSFTQDTEQLARQIDRLDREQQWLLAEHILQGLGLGEVHSREDLLEVIYLLEEEHQRNPKPLCTLDDMLSEFAKAK